MANIETITRSSGVRHAVKWREKRDGKEIRPNVGFVDADRAKRFRDLVDAAGNRWPDASVLIAQDFADLFDVPSAPARPVHADPDDYPGITLVQFCYLYVAGGTVRGGSDDNARSLQSYVRNHIAPFFKATKLVDVDRAQLRDWQNTYMPGKGLSAKTIAHVRGSLLHPVFERAMMRGDHNEPRLRDDNPLHGLPAPKVKKYRRPMLHDAGEVDLVLSAAFEVDPDAYDVMLFGVGTGCRWGEITGLPVGAVTLAADLSGGYVDVWQVAAKRQGKLPEGMARFHLKGDPKNENSKRFAPFGDRVATMLARRIADKAPDALVFAHPVDGLPHGIWNPITWRNKAMTPIIALAMARGLPRAVTMQGLRKTWVDNLYDARVNPVTAAMAAGHDPAVAVRFYTQALVSDLDPVRHATDRLLVA